jgi:hypothetical protein
MIQADLSINQDLISKVAKAKKVGGVAQVVEHLPSQLKALSSTTNTIKTKQNKKMLRN